MKYRMIVSDFDDTLARSDHTISQRTRTAIADYIRAGGVFTISTGRMHPSLVRQLDAIGLADVDIPLMSYQGASVRSSRTGQILHQSPIANDLAVSVARYFGDRDLYVHCYVDDQLLVPMDCPQVRMYAAISQCPFCVVGDIASHLARTGASPLKMLHIGDPNSIPHLIPPLQRAFGDLTFCTSHPTLLECVHQTATKGAAVRWVASHLGIDLAQVICVGDSCNDLSMISVAGLGVAVANAHPTLLAAAAWVCPSNNDDGIVEVIARAQTEE